MSGVVTRVAGGGQMGRVVLGGLDYGADLSVRPAFVSSGKVVSIFLHRAQPQRLPVGGFEVML